MDDAAGWDGCVAGKGSVRRKETIGSSSSMRLGANGARNADGSVKSRIMGGDPDEASATIVVYSCASFLAPDSTS